LIKRPATLALAAEDIMCLMIPETVRTVPLLRIDWVDVDMVQGRYVH
jgi:hypothetical protein